ncbi:MAG: nitroreductase family protein [Lawsonibacter sp.]
MEDLYSLIDQRSTCRAYKPDPIDPQVLNRVLAAGCKSPSSGGFQAISIVKITDAEKRKQLVAFSRGQQFIATAPVSLVFCVDYHRMAQVMELEPAPLPLPRQFKNLMMGCVDAAICAQTMALAAQAEGLGSCYNGNILNVADQLTRMLDLPDLVYPVVMLTLGWPKTVHRQPPKYPPDVLVHDNQYQQRPSKQLYDAYRKQNRWQKLPAKPEWVAACCDTARRLHGSDYAQAVAQDIAKKGYLGPYQYWFGCYYSQEPDFLSNQDYWSYFQARGFTWFDKEGDDEGCEF